MHVDDLAGVPARRVLLFGCGAAFVLILLAALAFLWMADDLLLRTVDSLQTKVEARLADDVPEAERTRLAWAFQDARRQVEIGRADHDELSRVLERLAELSRRPRDQPISAQEVTRLSTDLEILAGHLPPAEAP